MKEKRLLGDDRKYFIGELFRYAANIHSDNQDTGFMQIVPNAHLARTNSELHSFMLKQEIKEVSFAIITDKNNHVSILGTINSKRSSATRKLLEDVAVCFSMPVTQLETLFEK